MHEFSPLSDHLRPILPFRVTYALLYGLTTRKGKNGTLSDRRPCGSLYWGRRMMLSLFVAFALIAFSQPKLLPYSAGPEVGLHA